MPLRPAVLVTVLVLTIPALATAQGASMPVVARDSTVAERLAALPIELSLAEGRLRVINLYKLQGEILQDALQYPADTVVAQLVRAVYAPYTDFWNGYIGDEAAFRKWAVKLLDRPHPIHSRLEPLLSVNLDRRFTEGVAWIEENTGRHPEGTWYIVFGPGWTDMGGLTNIGMVADFTRMEPDSAAIARLLPHELTHQVHGAAPGRAGDPDAGTVLERVVSEGFATYVAWVYGGGAVTPAEALIYADEEWDWSLAHEHELFAAMSPLFGSRERAALNLVASRGDSVIPGAPGASGYFTGLRIVQAYVARHGPASWKELYDMPVAEVLERSGYAR